MKQNKCTKCGKPISRQVKLCRSCSHIGHKMSDEGREKMRQSKLGRKNPMWKEGQLSYSAVHNWVRANKPKPEKCECCKKVPPYDLASKNGNYIKDFDEWEYLCRRCHMEKDGRIRRNLKQYAE